MQIVNSIADSLSSVRDSACRISDINHTGNLLTPSGRDEIDRQLVRIMMDSQAIQRALCGSDAVLTYKEEALSQFDQLVGKYCEFGDDPDRDQLLDIAASAELLAQRTRNYLAVDALIRGTDTQQVQA